MHKRNITLTALVIAALISVAFVAYPKLTHSSAVEMIYLPSLLLTVILSGNSHSPSEAAGWISFVAYTLSYWIIFLVVYVILLELTLLRHAMDHLEEAKKNLAMENPDPKAALEAFGRAIAEVETRRRHHFLLKPVYQIDPTERPEMVATKALKLAPKDRLTNRVLHALMSKLDKAVTRERSGGLISKMQQEASTIAMNELHIPDPDEGAHD